MKRRFSVGYINFEHVCKYYQTGDTVTLAVPVTLRCLTNDNVASQSGRTMGLCPKPHKGTEFP